MKTRKVREEMDQEFRCAGEASKTMVLLKVSLEIVYSICVSDPGKEDNVESETYLSSLVKGVQNLSRLYVTDIGTSNKQDLDAWEFLYASCQGKN